MGVTRTMNKIMVLKANAPAIHKLGNLGCIDVEQNIRVYAENETDYIGQFEEGFGFIDVRFKKTDCRPLRQDEIDKLNKMVFTINDKIINTINLDQEGNFIRGER